MTECTGTVWWKCINLHAVDFVVISVVAFDVSQSSLLADGNVCRNSRQAEAEIKASVLDAFKSRTVHFLRRNQMDCFIETFLSG